MCDIPHVQASTDLELLGILLLQAMLLRIGGQICLSEDDMKAAIVGYAGIRRAINPNDNSITLTLRSWEGENDRTVPQEKLS